MCVLHVVHLDIHVHVYSTTFRHADMCICIVSENMYYSLCTDGTEKMATHTQLLS